MLVPERRSGASGGRPVSPGQVQVLHLTSSDRRSVLCTRPKHRCDSCANGADLHSVCRRRRRRRFALFRAPRWLASVRAPRPAGRNSGQHCPVRFVLTSSDGQQGNGYSSEPSLTTGRPPSVFARARMAGLICAQPTRWRVAPVAASLWRPHRGQLQPQTTRFGVGQAA